MPPLMQSQLEAIEGNVEVERRVGREKWMERKASTPPCLLSFGCVLAAERLEESNQSPICHLPFPLLPSSPVTTTDSPSAGWPRRRANDGQGIAHSRKHSWSSCVWHTRLNVGWQITCRKCALIRTWIFALPYLTNLIET